MLSRQTYHLLRTLFIVNGWRLLWMTILVIPILTNHIAYRMVENWLGNYGHSLLVLDAHAFSLDSRIYMDSSESKERGDIATHTLVFREKLKEETTQQVFRSCHGKDQCQDLFFRSLYGNLDHRYTSYAEYGKDNEIPRIACQVKSGMDLHCPFFSHLVVTAHNTSLYQFGHTFGRAEFFCLTANAERTAFRNLSFGGTPCSKRNYVTVFAWTVVIQAMLVVIAAFLYVTMSTVCSLADLKMNGFMRILFQKGLSVRSYWLALWIFVSLPVICMAGLLTMSYALQCPGFYSAASLLAVFFITALHLLSIAALGFLMSVVLKDFFHMGLVMVLIAVCVSTIIFLNHRLLSNKEWLKILLVFVIPLGHLGEFIQAHLLTALHPDGVTAYHRLILAANLIFLVAVISLTIYLDFILQTGNGFCLSPGYIFDKRFWSYNAHQDWEPAQDPLVNEKLPDMANVEPMKEGLNPIVRIHQLTKHYTSRSCSHQNKETVIALNGISAEIYEGQITAIIGHNGSGKTTLLNILNGTDSPTSGRVSVDGLLVSDPINRMRLHQRTGICEQENSLCNCLTVMQTLQLALVCCNLSFDDGKTNLEYLLNILRLFVKKGVKTEKLSIGTKRKLCTAVALIGESKLLFLDEPTSGVDPVSRRRIWKLLQECKQKCSIILSTQSMEEADTFADRKIFLSSGVLICAGSSLFLKSAFDCGFEFNVTLKSPDSAKLLVNAITETFDFVRVRHRVGSSITLYIPSAQFSDVPMLALALERRSSLIASYGLQQTSLCEIFLRFKDLQQSDAAHLAMAGQSELQKPDQGDKQKSVRRQSSVLPGESNAAMPSAFARFYCLICFNILRLFRSRLKLATRIGVPVVLLLLLLTMAIVEKTTGTTRFHLMNNITNFGDNFAKGVCIFNETTSKRVVNNSVCAEVFMGASMRAKEHDYLALHLPEGTRLYEYLQNWRVMEIIKVHCNLAQGTSSECPIIYTDKWNKRDFNRNRMVSIGSLSTFETLNYSVSASVTIGAYYRLMRYFLSEDFQTGFLHPGAFRLLAQSMYEFRSIFVPLYGTFVQLLIISIIPATFLDDLIEDKESMVRTHLSSMGLGTVSYWVTMYLVHWIQYAVIYMISVILVISVNSAGYACTFYILGIVLPTLFLGLSNNQLFVYILSSLLKKFNPIVTVAYFMFSVILVILILTLQLSSIIGTLILTILPPMATIALTFYGTKSIFYSLSFLRTDSLEAGLKNGLALYFSQQHIMVSLFCIIAQSVLLPIALLVVERRYFFAHMLTRCISSEENRRYARLEDSRVNEEIKMLYQKPRNPDHILEIRNLRMKFSPNVKVLRDICFAASPGDIFGILGPNGAGKSTTMAIIVGDLSPTDGCCEVRCGERWLPSCLAAKRGYIGYCPQYNPLYSNITVREHLEFYASIMGVAPNDAGNRIESLLETLEISGHECKPSSELSFGLKRRLSLASALLSDACLLVIDEACTGVDADGRQSIWRLIREIADHERRAVIVATHSMEEAEALCSRVGVMNHGMLIGLGSVAQLKSQYGQAYVLELLISPRPGETAQMKNSKRDALSRQVLAMFEDATVVEEFANTITFSLTQESITGRFSSVLSWLIALKARQSIQFFTLFQMSLDQVFAMMIAIHDKMVVRTGSVYSVMSETSEWGSLVLDSPGKEGPL